MEVKITTVIFLLLAFLNFNAAQKIAEQKCQSFYSKITSSNTRIKRVVGGTQTYDGEFPYMVAVGYGNASSPEFLCGGTLISDQYVLTAAQCATYNKSPLAIVRLGSKQLTGKTGFTDATITEIIVHPKYKRSLASNDIALLKLKDKVSFSSSIFPACLHTTKELTESQKSLTALGWGKTGLGSSISNELLKVTLEYVPIAQCNATYGRSTKLPYGLIDDQQLCAGGTRDRDTCQGDSGGPLGYKSENIHFIVGVTSFGKGCGGGPGVYTRVSGFLSWIESVVWST